MRYLSWFSSVCGSQCLNGDEVSCTFLAQSDLPIYSIGAVERMLGIPAATVRNWEDRYGLVRPGRSGGGHRLYTRAQVEQLRFVKDQLDRGMQPAEAHRLLGEELEREPSSAPVIKEGRRRAS